MNNIRSWIVIIFEIFAPIVFFFFSFCSNGKERKRNGNQEKRQANQTEMSVNYWKNVFLSPLCDRSYKTGIYFDSAWIDFALTGANIRVKNHEVCERVRARHSGWKIPILSMHGQTTSQPKRVINVCTSLQTISNRLLEFGNAIDLVRVHTYIQHLLGLDWTGCCRFIYMKFFFLMPFRLNTLFKSIVSETSAILMRGILFFIFLLLFGVWFFFCTCKTFSIQFISVVKQNQEKRQE